MFEDVIETVGRAIAAVGVTVIVIGLVVASERFLSRLRSPTAYHDYRRGIGRSLLLGLELLVAADIIATVTMSPSLSSVFALAIIVLVRTFLSLSIELEVEGRLPWRRAEEESEGAA